ncbi:MAG: hypothetical protein K2K02_10300 [Ruminococcus sp.]|nr:hypothetical protein [Ruminococcus sp.]
MAKLKVPTDYNGKEKIQLYEPARGIGGNVRATSFVLHKQNINYQRCLRVM